jgi:quercetin dioxygenase-like cupin family protein
MRGSFRFQLEGESSTTLPAGSVFYEPGGARVLHFDNVSDQ